VPQAPAIPFWSKNVANPPEMRFPLSLELGAAVWEGSGVEVGAGSEGAGVVVVAGAGVGSAWAAAGVGSAWAAGAAWEAEVAAGAAEVSSSSPSSQS
jgi:hypothetical protein